MLNWAQSWIRSSAFCALFFTGLMSFSSALRKSPRSTRSLSPASGSTSTFEAALMSRFSAVDWAPRTRPSISAPLKFLVSIANSYAPKSPAKKQNKNYNQKLQSLCKFAHYVPSNQHPKPSSYCHAYGSCGCAESAAYPVHWAIQSPFAPLQRHRLHRKTHQINLKAEIISL